VRSFRLLILFFATALFASVFVLPASASTSAKTLKWVDQKVSFSAGGLTVYATYRHPSNDHKAFAGVLLIAGSGPTDRNGNSTEEPGPINTLKTLADWLSLDGVASLRYDKLGSGKTGLGSFASKPDSIGVLPFEQESAAALRFLAAQKGINKQRLGVFGHSEGALYALLLATGHAGTVPPIHALGLIEPLSLRYLDLISVQIGGQLAAQVQSGAITKKLSATVSSTTASAIARLRSTGKVAANLPYGLSSVLSPSSATYLYQADKIDPETLAASLAAGTPVLVTCSSADLQVTCSEVSRIVAGLSTAKAKTDLVKLNNVDHVLKVDPSGAATNYTRDFPFSPVLKAALKTFVETNLK
jgi:alpha-beta hydrolase superfamily lysophospholipase